MSEADGEASTSSHPSRNMEDLLDDLWGCIIGKLSNIHHKNALRGTCTRLRRLVNFSVTALRVDPSATDTLSRSFSTSFPCATSLELCKPGARDALTDAVFAQWVLQDLVHLPSLTSVNLEHSMLSVSGVAALALACPQIQAVTLPRLCQVRKNESLLLVLPRLAALASLKLRCCNDVPVAPHLVALTQLTSLELESFGGHVAHDLSPLTHLTRLRSVVVWANFDVGVWELANHLQMMNLPGGGGGGGHHGGGLGPAGAMAEGLIGPLGAAAVGALQQWQQQQGQGQQGGQGQQQQHQHHHPNLHLGPHHHAVIIIGGGGGDGGIGGGGGGGMANVHPGNHHHHALIGGGGGGVGGGGGGGDGLPPGPTHPLAALFYAALVGGPVAVHAPAKSSLLEWLSSLPHLTTIDIQRTNVEVHELECLSAITGLGHLGVGDLTLESPLRMEPLCSVTKLVTHNCDGARLLPQVFPQLRGLSCDACDETLADLAPLTGLHHLLLWQQPSPLTPLTDAGLCSLAGMAGLQELRLEGATGLSDAGWSSFASSHAHLTRLHLTGVAGVSSAAIGVAAASTPALQAVLLSSMPVDAAGLASLLALCPSLSSIELEDCDHLSQADVRTAMAEMPRALGVGVGVGGDLTVVCRKGGAFKKLHWPPVAT